MTTTDQNISGIAIFRYFILATTFALFCMPVMLNAQDDEYKDATIKLTFSQTDTTRTCTALVMSDTMPVPELTVHFYVERFFGLLPVGEADTDESGLAIAEFPIDLPGDENDMLSVLARIEEDDTYGDVETRAQVKWGVIPEDRHDHWSERSLSAARDQAPMYLIVASNLIISIIWGTIIYVILQVFRIRKAGTHK